MLVDEATRHELHTRIEELLGPRLAGALMSLLPADEPVTKSDLAATEQRLKAYLEQTLRGAIVTQTKWLVGTVVTLILGMIASTAVLVQAILSRIPVLSAG